MTSSPESVAFDIKCYLGRRVIQDDSLESLIYDCQIQFLWRLWEHQTDKIKEKIERDKALDFIKEAVQEWDLYKLNVKGIYRPNL